ncbi:MAG: hypothetical protein JWQ33_1474 [Ramlibacter sp.]|nr:hypothetical protein [Ramlibacter sp.]
MNEQPNRISAALAAAWAAVRRAFTASPGPGASQGYEADTTLFGGLPEQPGADRPPAPPKDDFWDPNGESSYFADADGTRKNERH